MYIASLICLLALGSTKSGPDAVVYRGEYPGWPWVTRTPGGRLVCTWREGERHMFSAAGRLMIGTSEDQGRTWSEPRVFHDEPGIDDRNVAILALTETDWLAAYNTYTADNRSRVHTLRTRDGGKTWSARQRISDLDARTRAAPIKLSTGELVLPFYREPNIQSYAAISADDGKTWSLVAIENFEGFLGDEWSVCELPDGRLVGIIRNSAPGNDGSFYKTESRNGGRSWSRPSRTNLRDTRKTSPAQIFMHAGRPVVLYPDARLVSVAMAVTDDPGLVRWNVAERLHCYRYREDGRPIADGGYPVSVPIGGNRRFIVDYEHDGDEHRIAGYFVELSGAFSRNEPRDMPIESTDVFKERTGGYFAYRIPALETAADGSLLAFAEARKYNLDDPGFGKQDIDLVLKRSEDGGRTWSPMQLIEDPGELWSAANPATVVDRTNGRIWLLYLRCKPERNTNTARPGTDDSQVFARTSDDSGKTWSGPIDLTGVSRDFRDATWRISVVGPGGMIQDRQGRLLAAMWRFEPFGNFTLASDDHGKTWRRGPFLPAGGNECQLVELSDGRLLMDIRQEKTPHRFVATSGDAGQTWSARRRGLDVTPVACAIERYTSKAGGADRDRILWTGPKGPGRRNLVVRISYDEGESFPVERPIAVGHAAYSDLSILKDRSVGVLWERGVDHGYQTITFTRLTREFLEPAAK
jgi:sialidase-1